VILSLFGPDPYPFAYNREEDFESMDQISSKPKCVEMQPLSVNNLVFSKESYNCNEDGMLRKDGLFEANDPLLNQATCQSKQI